MTRRPIPTCAAVLTTVASREGEHGMSFAKRVVELGFEFERIEHPSLAEKVGRRPFRSQRHGEGRVLRSHSRRRRRSSFFDNVFKDHSIDIRTGELLGRYIAEEHDTARLAKCCYDALCALAARHGGVTRASVRRRIFDEDALARTVERGVHHRWLQLAGTNTALSAPPGSLPTKPS